jgi:hypothetical protein
MVSQGLFGEYAFVLECGERDWVRLRFETDGYTGWADAKQWDLAPETEGGEARLTALWADADRGEGTRLRLSMGACVAADSGSSEDWVELAAQWLGSPYLWGGRTPAGVDCSGLVQVTGLAFGISLPRDASAQAQVGEEVLWADRKRGDLAFFANAEGRVTHVGILSSPEEIIHAAGEVRKDRLTKEGIYRADRSEPTHVFHGMRRVSNVRPSAAISRMSGLGR